MISPVDFRLGVIQGEITLENLDSYKVDVRCPGLGCDPISQEYSDFVMHNYSLLVGAEYDVSSSESFALPLDEHIQKTWPFVSGELSNVANYFGGICSGLSRVSVPKNSDILEMGAGWGHLSLLLSAAGHNVTAVDINAGSLEHLRLRSLGNSLTVKCLNASYEDNAWSVDKYDLIIFHESFHHSRRLFQLLAQCRDSLRDNGAILFIAEPFYKNYASPWNIQADPFASYMMVKQGWLELAFDLDFVISQVELLGLSCQRYENPQFGAFGTSLYCRAA